MGIDSANLAGVHRGAEYIAHEIEIAREDAAEFLGAGIIGLGAGDEAGLEQESFDEILIRAELAELLADQGLEARERKAQRRKRAAQAARGRVADAATIGLHVTDVDAPAQERAGGEHDGARAKGEADAGADTDDAAARPLAGTRIQGPAPAPMARIKGVYRYQILIRSTQRTALRRAVQSVMSGRRWKGVDFIIDVDPINIL